MSGAADTVNLLMEKILKQELESSVDKVTSTITEMTQILSMGKTHRQMTLDVTKTLLRDESVAKMFRQSDPSAVKILATNVSAYVQAILTAQNVYMDERGKAVAEQLVNLKH